MVQELTHIIPGRRDRPLDPRMSQLAAAVWAQIDARHNRALRFRAALFAQTLAIAIALAIGMLSGHASAARYLSGQVDTMYIPALHR